MDEKGKPRERPIRRREFVNGLAAISATAALAPAGRLAATEKAPAPGAPVSPSPRAYSPAYPPGLTGLRGNHVGSFEVAHDLALGGGKWPPPKGLLDAPYDLIVVGGGVSGLTAAWKFRQRAGPKARILILDNHDDFGGHAKRNEFHLDGRTLIGFGGSQSIDGPTSFSRVSMEVIEALGIDVDKFNDYFDAQHYPRHDAGDTGIYFDAAHYGEDKIVSSPFPIWFNESRVNPTAQVEQFPISKPAKEEMLRLLDPGRDLLAKMPLEEKKRLLSRISYEDFLRKHGRIGDEVVLLLRNLSTAGDAVGYDALPASYAVASLAPGTAGLGVEYPGEMRGEQDPYIYHFPDGNASVARLLVRALLPGAIPGKTMEDIVLARVNYDVLDTGKQATRLRLQSTAVNVAHTADRKNVDVTYVQYGQTCRVRGRHVILATYNQMIPALCPELSASQKTALAFQEKAPIVYSNILLRNWRAFAELGIHQIYSPQGFCHCAWLDFPVSMGGYAFSRDPDQPILVHAVHVPNQPGRGLSMREQFRLGRRQLYRMDLEDYRRAILAQLDGALAAGGFDAERDVADMTVNRWPHGYSYSYNELDDDPSWFGTGKGPHLAARAQHERISIANADAQASAYMDAAMDSGIRAADEQSKRA